jgi:hypothetical protein
MATIDIDNNWIFSTFLDVCEETDKEITHTCNRDFTHMKVSIDDMTLSISYPKDDCPIKIPNATRVDGPFLGGMCRAIVSRPKSGLTPLYFHFESYIKAMSNEEKKAVKFVLSYALYHFLTTTPPALN